MATLFHQHQKNSNSSSSATSNNNNAAPTSSGPTATTPGGNLTIRKLANGNTVLMGSSSGLAPQATTLHTNTANGGQILTQAANDPQHHHQMQHNHHAPGTTIILTADQNGYSLPTKFVLPSTVAGGLHQQPQIIQLAPQQLTGVPGAYQIVTGPGHHQQQAQLVTKAGGLMTKPMMMATNGLNNAQPKIISISNSAGAPVQIINGNGGQQQHLHHHQQQQQQPHQLVSAGGNILRILPAGSMNNLVAAGNSGGGTHQVIQVMGADGRIMTLTGIKKQAMTGGVISGGRIVGSSVGGGVTQLNQNNNNSKTTSALTFATLQQQQQQPQQQIVTTVGGQIAGRSVGGGGGGGGGVLTTTTAGTIILDKAVNTTTTTTTANRISAGGGGGGGGGVGAGVGMVAQNHHHQHPHNNTLNNSNLNNRHQQSQQPMAVMSNNNNNINRSTFITPSNDLHNNAAINGLKTATTTAAATNISPPTQPPSTSSSLALSSSSLHPHQVTNTATSAPSSITSSAMTTTSAVQGGGANAASERSSPPQDVITPKTESFLGESADTTPHAAMEGEAATEASQQEQDGDGDGPEIDIVINNVVCSFSVKCHLNLREIALNGTNVEFRRENGMVTMKLRKPYTTASMWSSGKITCTGATSEEQAKVAARRYARCLQKLEFKTRLHNFRIVNVLGTCHMPWDIKITNFSERHRADASYEPELHPGVTYKLKEPKATLKIFSTGSVTVTSASVSNVQQAIEIIYPLLYDFRKERPKQVVAPVPQAQATSGLEVSSDEEVYGATDSDDNITPEGRLKEDSFWSDEDENGKSVAGRRYLTGGSSVAKKRRLEGKSSTSAGAGGKPPKNRRFAKNSKPHRRRRPLGKAANDPSEDVMEVSDVEDAEEF